jgi:hypothetical protein
MKEINEFIGCIRLKNDHPSVGADLSRPPPIYRPPVDVMMSALKR